MRNILPAFLKASANQPAHACFHYHLNIQTAKGTNACLPLIFVKFHGTKPETEKTLKSDLQRTPCFHVADHPEAVGSA
jgi:hypothetical protein